MNRTPADLKLVLSALAISVAAAWVAAAVSGCGGYDHIPLASKATTAGRTATLQVTLQWNDVPDALSYNVYWSRFPGVTKHNGHKIPDAANPITLTDLESGRTYYFVVTVVGASGESKESRQMSSDGLQADAVVDFKDLFERPLKPPSPRAVEQQYATDEKQTPAVPPRQDSLPAGPAPTAPKQELKPDDLPAAVAPPQNTQTSKNQQVTLAWDDVPGAISYNIYWRDRPGVTKRNGIKITNVKNPHILTNLVAGKTYYLVVTAVSKSGESSISAEMAFTVEPSGSGAKAPGRPAP